MERVSDFGMFGGDGGVGCKERDEIGKVVKRVTALQISRMGGGAHPLLFGKREDLKVPRSIACLSIY